MNATQVFPQPRPVYLGDPDEGGRLYLVTEMRLRHLGLLQALVEAQHPHPYYDIACRRPDEDDDTYHDRLVDALDACADWPPSVTDPKTLLHSTPDQLERRYVFELFIGVRNDSRPRPTLAACTSLLPRVYPHQWDRFRDVLWGVDLRKRIVRMIDAEFDPESDKDRSDMPSFSEAVDSISRSRNWTYDQVGRLYLSQWFSVMKQGKLDEEEFVDIPGLPSFDEQYHQPGREAELKSYGERRFEAVMRVVDRQRAKFGRRKPSGGGGVNGNGNGHGGAV